MSHILLTFKHLYINEETHTKCRYSNCQPNETKEKGEAIQPCYQQ